MEKIILLRQKIDAIDDQIMALLDARFNHAIEIGELKKASSIQILDTNREEIIMDKINRFSHKEAIDQVYSTLLKTSKTLQRKL